MPRESRGRVILVGAGPGDPGLLTLRGREALLHADTVVYDRLVSREVVDVAPSRAKRIPAESLGPHGARRQRGIDRTLVREARRGRFVVRLKGGDPFIFGRGMEEIEALEGEGIPCDVVPGVTSAIAAPATARIPVTHRDYSSIVTIATGHEAGGKETVPWERIAKLGGTLVVLMCSDQIATIVRRLRHGGLRGSTPCAVISRGTLPDQRVRLTTLTRLRRAVREFSDPGPMLVVVGEVARLASQDRLQRATTHPRLRVPA